MANSKISLAVALENFNNRGIRTATASYVDGELVLTMSESSTMPGFRATFNSEKLAAEYLMGKSAKYTSMRLYTGKI